MSLRLDNDGYLDLSLPAAWRLQFRTKQQPDRGYLHVIAKNEFAPPVKIWECPYSIEEEGRMRAEQLLPTSSAQRHPCGQRRLAMGVIEAARQHRLRVPEDVWIVGFDDIPASGIISPQLTTANQPLREKDV